MEALRQAWCRFQQIVANVDLETINEFNLTLSTAHDLALTADKRPFGCRASCQTLDGKNARSDAVHYNSSIIFPIFEKFSMKKSSNSHVSI